MSTTVDDLHLQILRTAAFIDWLGELRDGSAKARIARRIDRMIGGNFGDVKSVGEGVSELRIDHGPGTRRGSVTILLLCGGDKDSQNRDIARAKSLARHGRIEAMKLETRPYDSAEFLDSDEALEEYLKATCEDGSAAEIAHALGVIARA